MLSTVETLFVCGSRVGEGSTVEVYANVGMLVSVEDTGIVFGGALVGSSVLVGAMKRVGIGEQALSKMKAAAMKCFIEGNYMSVNVVARRSAPRAERRVE